MGVGEIIRVGEEEEEDERGSRKNLGGEGGNNGREIEIKGGEG